MAKTIIDSLVLELGFDTQGMEKGRKQVEDTFKKTQAAATKTGRDIEDSSKKAGEYVTRLRNNLLGLFAAFTAGRGVKDFVSDVTSSDAALGRFARTINTSAKDIAEWRGAGRLLGVSADDIDSTFSNLSSQFQQFAITGDSTLVPWFRALGMTMSDATGNMRPINDMLLELSQRVQTMNPAKATAFMQNMGISPGMINLILQGPVAIQKLIDKQKELAAAQAADAAAAAARQLAWEEFISQAEAIGTILLTSVTPALIAVTKAGTAFAQWGEHHPELVGAAFAALTGIVVALSVAITATLVGSAITSVVGGFTVLINLAKGLALGLAVISETAIPALSEAFFAMGLAIEATPIGILITGIAGISVAGYELVKHWTDIKNWWHSLWGGMAADTKAGTDKINENTKTSGSKPSAVPPKTQAQQDIAKLEGMGWSRDDATAIVANLQGESGGKTGAVGDRGQAYGLAQWHPDRQKSFMAWAGHTIQTATRDEQLGFVNYELRGRESAAGNALRAAPDLAAKTAAVTKYYERPADVAGQSALRAITATQLAGLSRPNGATNNSSSSEVNIQQIHVHTAATDAKGIARDLKKALQQDTFAQQSNYGPS